ncbi:MAG: hypothetical protein FJ202_05420 [Gemmatimonadetes bacterium]|nr:hypothetical protein [Gemmatimonadota bacterium]
MWGLIGLLISLSVAFLGYGTARRFVRERLRYVDSAHSPAAPIIAGVVACAVAVPVVWFLPIVGAGTALAFGLSVGFGARAGSADVKRGYLVSSGG